VIKLGIHSKGGHGLLAGAANPENRSKLLVPTTQGPLLPYPVAKKVSDVRRKCAEIAETRRTERNEDTSAPRLFFTARKR
jgi:hypothetical protein